MRTLRITTAAITLAALVAAIVGLWCWSRDGYGGLKLKRAENALPANLYQTNYGIEAFREVVGVY